MEKEKSISRLQSVCITAVIMLVFFCVFWIDVEALSISPDKPYAYVGDTVELMHKFILNKEDVSPELYERITERHQVEWSVSNSNATVSPDGTLTAISKGVVTVTATSGELSDSFELEIRVPVEDFTAEDIILNTYSKTGSLNCSLIPIDAYVEDICVSIGDASIATYNENIFTANSIGETVATITIDGISKEVPLKVMQATESIYVENMTVIQGSGKQLNVLAQPENAEAGLSFKYESSDESIVNVSSSGWVSAIGKGTATITVTNEFGQKTECEVTVKGYPLTYSDATSNITIYREWYGNAYVYAAHITFTDYSRFGTACGRNVYGGAETTSSAAARQRAILCINGDYASPNLGYRVARSGVVINDGSAWAEGFYSRSNGILAYRDNLGIAGRQLSSLVSSGIVSDTFQFGPAFLINGSVVGNGGGSRAQRTFIGTNGNPGDIWLCVSDGRHNDGISAGLTGLECAQYLQSKGCTFGIPLDGGGSSTIVFQGTVLNAAAGKQRSVVDFVYFR